MLQRKKLIISADDFGISDTANRNIIELARAGKLDRVSVMVERQHLEPELVREILNLGVPIDLHLDISAGQIRKVRRKIKSSPYARLLIFALKKSIGRFGVREVKERWFNQTKKFISVFGQKPDGLNSHEHIHFLPGYFKVMLNLSNYFAIRHVRFGRLGIIANEAFVSKVLSYLWKKDSIKYSANIKRIETSDYIASLDWYLKKESFLTTFPSGRIELITHPEITEEFKMIKKFL